MTVTVREKGAMEQLQRWASAEKPALPGGAGRGGHNRTAAASLLPRHFARREQDTVRGWTAEEVAELIHYLRRAGQTRGGVWDPPVPGPGPQAGEATGKRAGARGGQVEEDAGGSAPGGGSG